jgi:hypothetical protein
VDATQNLSAALPLHEPPAFSHQSRRRHIAVQNTQVSVHDKSRARHGIEQHPMKTMIQELYINPAHTYI